jgi:integrase
MTASKHAGGRPRKGTLEFRGKTWHARLTVTVEGESLRKWYDLGTDNKAVARRKLARLSKDQETTNPTPITQLAEVAKRAETVSEAAERIFKERVGEVRDVVNDPIRFRKHVAPHIGKLPVTDVGSSHIREVLNAGKEDGKSHKSLVHLRRVMNLIFGLLWQDEVIRENPVARVKVPKVETDRRERSVLTDAELVRYLGWQHPEEHHGMAVLERQTMACISRCFGGLRTGDMHALRWESLDTADGAFAFGWAPRKKTARPHLLEIPEMLRPLIRDWWERAGKPATGLLFAARRGKHAGTGPKIGVSHADAFRRDLRRAFGVDVWDAAKHQFVADPEHEMTPRERELLEDTPFTKPVDFHSWRRAYSQALGDAGLSATQTQKATGHASLSALERYLHNTTKMAAVPAAALPTIRVLPQLVAKPPAKLKKTKAKNPVLPGFFGGLRGEDLNLRPSGYEAKIGLFRLATQRYEIIHNH